MKTSLPYDDNNSLFAAIVACAPDAIITVDTANIITSCNNSAEHICDCLSGDVIGKPLDAIVSLRHLAKLLPLNYAAFVTPVCRTLTFDAGNENAVFEISIAPLNIGGDGVMGAIIRLHDISLQKAMRLETDAAQKKLQDKLAEKDVWNDELEAAVKKKSAAITEANELIQQTTAKLNNANTDLQSITQISSHDLQEPLRKLLVFSSIVAKEENKLSDTARRYLKNAQAEAKRMQRLLKDFVLYNNIRHSKNAIPSISIKTVIQKVMNERGNSLQEKHAAIRYGGLCEVSVVESELYIIIGNLIDNSIKFAHPERHLIIRISCRLAAGARYECSRLKPGQVYTCISFADNGIGFDNQFAERIFEPFQQLHRAENYGGTGIGLAMCKRIVEYHNGIITAKGKPGIGTRIDFYIPA